MAASPPLCDDIVEEILARLPPDDPASLLRAALACKRWARLVSGPGFRARLRRGGGAPMLGFLCDLRGGFDGAVSRFVPTSSFRPPVADHRGWLALDARHGRVLLCREPGSDLVIWDPMTDERRVVTPVAVGTSPAT